MPNGVTPELLSFIITLAQYMLFAFGILIAGATVVYITLFWRVSSPARPLPTSCNRPTSPSWPQSS
jgi:hypothetical protein